MPLNSFVCRRRSCQKEFDADFDASNGSPFCPHCGGTPCKWIPRAVNVGKTAPALDRGMERLVKEHNERVGPAQKITNIRCERGLPAVRPPPETGESVKKIFSTPVGPVEGRMPTRHGSLTGPSFVMSALADAERFKLKQNEDGRPSTPIRDLGGVVERPPRPTPIVEYKG